MDHICLKCGFVPDAAAHQMLCDGIPEITLNENASLVFHSLLPSHDEDRPYFTIDEMWRIEQQNDKSREWAAQYLCEPYQQPSGIYCKRCGHSNEGYFETMGAGMPESLRHLHGQFVCGNGHCCCHPHMDETYEITAKVDTGE